MSNEFVDTYCFNIYNYKVRSGIMNSKKHKDIKEFLDSISDDEFYSMVMEANENLDLEDFCKLEFSEKYSVISNLKYDNNSQLDLYKSNDISKAA
jgi:hypothetical protein